MLTKAELEIYRRELLDIRNIGLCAIKLLRPIIVRNKRFTSGFFPLRTKSIDNACWADQWMALSGNVSGIFTCACCGKFVFADVNTPECVKIAEGYCLSGVIEDCTPETLQVQDGHIVLLEDIRDNNGYILAHRGSTHIVPLCKECNNFNVSSIELKVGPVITPEMRQLNS